MNRIAFLVLTVFLLAICSCENKKEEESRELYLSMKDKRTCFPEDLFESFDVVPLETTDSVLFDEVVGKILKKDNLIYILYQDFIYIYNEQGKYIRTINHKGEGPGCYLSVMSFVLWENGEMYILDRISASIYKYSKDDKFLGKVPMSMDEFNALDIRDIMCLNDSVLLLRSNDKRKVPFKMHAMERETGKIISNYLEQHEKMITYWFYDNYSFYEGNLFLNLYQNSNIYRLTADSAYIHYTINVENKMPPEGFWDNMQLSDMQLVQIADREGYINHIPFFMETDDNILLKFEDSPHGEMRYYTFIDKKTRKNYLIEHLRMDDLDYIPEYMFPIKDGEAYFLIPADIICEKGEKFKQKYCPELKEDDNPVLCKVKIK